MVLRLKNTYGGKLNDFAPLDAAGRRVTMYTCGPTVYSYAHIGNFRSFLLADVLRRVLERRGFLVRQVMNITDVGHMTEDHLADAAGEDKLAKAAREIGTDPVTVARHFESAFVQDARALRLSIYGVQEGSDRTIHPRATEHVPEMLAMIQRLLDRGYAYIDSMGQVYFEVARFPEYGALSGKVLEDLEPGARVAVRDEKRDPRDFALWKVDEKHLMKWNPHSSEGWEPWEWERFRQLAPLGVDSRIGIGFPGWHIECSAMARAHAGEVIDIHTGGEDNIFPHHECEIAQSWGAYGDMVEPPQGGSHGAAAPALPTFARYWVHGRHLVVNGRKMSKRDGTFFTVRDMLDPGSSGRAELREQLKQIGFFSGRVAPNVLRYALIATPFSQPMNFGFDVLSQARASVARLQSCFDRLRERALDSDPGGASEGIVARARAAEHDFDAALDDNLNMSGALAAVFAWISALNQSDEDLSACDAALAVKTLAGFDRVLDVLDHAPTSGLVPHGRLAELAAAASVDSAKVPDALDEEAIAQTIALRQAARSAKRFELADEIRAVLRDRGVTLEDTRDGVRWKRQAL